MKIYEQIRAKGIPFRLMLNLPAAWVLFSFALFKLQTRDEAIIGFAWRCSPFLAVTALFSFSYFAIGEDEGILKNLSMLMNLAAFIIALLASLLLVGIESGVVGIPATH